MTASGFLHQAKSLIRGSAALVVLASVVSIAAAQPQPTLEYVFNSGTDSLSKAGGINDHSGNKYNGTELSGGTEASFVTGHKSGTTAIMLLGDDDPASTDTEPGIGTGIDTGIDTGTVGLDMQSWTVMAWINRTCFKGDEMVFGSGGGTAVGQYLHLGFRRASAYYGVWTGGNDSSAYVGNLVGVYEWHHMAWRYDVVAGTRSIFIDGAQIFSEPGTQYLGFGTNLMIGGNFGYAGGEGAGMFAGMIEHPRVFGGQALRNDQIAADANDNPIPP